MCMSFLVNFCMHVYTVYMYMLSCQMFGDVNMHVYSTFYTYSFFYKLILYSTFASTLIFFYRNYKKGKLHYKKCIFLVKNIEKCGKMCCGLIPYPAKRVKKERK